MLRCDYSYVWTDCKGRRESQGSLSSGASQELNTSCPINKNEVHGSGPVLETFQLQSCSYLTGL